MWLQEQQLRRLIELAKVLGTRNPADFMTKNLTREQLDQYAEMLGFKFEDGGSETTAQLHSVLRHVFSAFAGSAVWEGT